MKIVAVDPSLTCTGLAAIDVNARQVVEWTVLKTKVGNSAKGKTDDMADRLFTLGREFRAFHERHGGVIVMESQTASTHGRAGPAQLGKLMAAYGAFLGACPTRPVVLPPITIRSRLRAESKAEAYIRARDILQLADDRIPPPPKSAEGQEAVQDAVSVAAAALPDVRQLYAMLPKET